MCIPPKIALEAAQHKKFNLQEFWDEHFPEEEDDESSDDESGDESENDETPIDKPECDEGDDDEDDDTSSDCDSEDSWEGEPPPLKLNYNALKHIAEYFIPGSHGACVDITTLERGNFYENRVLHFEDGWSCAGRFMRDSKAQLLEQVESALATMRYVREHTSIPVPQVYFVNHNENHVVGSAFVIMEQMPGEWLDELWSDLSHEDRLSIIGEIADNLGQLAALKFDCIGSLRHDGTVGPLLSTTGEARRLGDQPFTTTEDYVCAYINEDDPDRSEDAKEYYPAIKEELLAFLYRMGDNPTIRAPYRLVHGCFEHHNILAERRDGVLRISGIVDWDMSHTGPLYQVCEYPHCIVDHDGEEEDFEANKALRQHFVASLAKHFPRGSADREQVKQCFREKNYAWQKLRTTFMSRTLPPESEEEHVTGYLRGLRGDSNGYFTRPYMCVWDWQADSELESDGE